MEARGVRRSSGRTSSANTRESNLRELELSTSGTSRSSRTSFQSTLRQTDYGERDTRSTSFALLNPAQERASRWHSCARFLLHSVVHLVSTALRVVSILIYYKSGDIKIFYLQVGIGVLALMASVQITMQDSDVRRWAASGSACLYCLTWMGSLLLLGVCQLIYVKRAWARRLRLAEVLQPDHDDDPEGRLMFLRDSYNPTGPAVGGERMMPVALLIGPPFALVSSYAYLGLEHDYLDTQLLLCAVVSAICTVTLGVVDVDLAVSSYVAHRYHFDVTRSGTRAGRTQCCYPFFQFSFRFFEVSTRTAMLTQFLILARQTFIESDWLLLCAGVAMLLVDLLVCSVFLRCHSPKEESWLVHLLVAWLLLMANTTCFVDMPGYSYPARLISRQLDCWRFIQLAGLATAVVMGYEPCIASQVYTITIGGQTVSLGYGTVGTIASATLWLAFRCIPIIIKRGDDLHTAVWRGRKRRVEKLLGAVQASTAGEALDVNGHTKDGVQASPAMIAADGGRAEILSILLSRGARVDDTDLAGKTCLHYAAANVHIECLRILVNTTKGQKILRCNHAQLLALAERRSARLREDEQAEVVRLLTPHRNFTAEDCGVRSVRAPLVSSKNLGGLFPDANEEEDAPSLQDLQSVSALLVAHATGPLARCLMAIRRPFSESSAGPVSLDQLRRKALLGQGASGRVIEVEVRESSSTALGGRMFSHVNSGRTSIASMSMLATATATGADQGSRLDESPVRRFALKLQPKRSSHQAHSELVALQRASHPFIVRLEHAFQTAHHFALLLEYCPGGDINRLLCAQAVVESSSFSDSIGPQQAARYGGQVLLALIYLHESLGFVYRDVKPENMLISHRDQAKLADFGLALHVGEHRRKHLKAEGTPGFLAPELIYGDADADDADDGRLDPFKTDAYSYGVSLELMFLGTASGEIYEESDGGKWILPRAWASDEEKFGFLQSQKDAGRLTPEALDILRALLSRHPKKRRHLQEVREHPFFRQILQFQVSLEEALLPGAGRRMGVLA